MINKLISVFLILLTLSNTAFAEPYAFYSDKYDSEENVFPFKAELMYENFSDLKFDLAYFPMTDLPENMPKESTRSFKFKPLSEGLFCLDVSVYNQMLTIVKTNKYNLASVIATERKSCKEKKENIRRNCQEREDVLKEKIKQVETKLQQKTNDLIFKQNEYKLLEKKMFWLQIGSGAAILAISGFAIYSVQK